MSGHLRQARLVCLLLLSLEKVRCCTWVSRDPLGDCVAEQIPQQEITGLSPTENRVPVPAETSANNICILSQQETSSPSPTFIEIYCRFSDESLTFAPPQLSRSRSSFLSGRQRPSYRNRHRHWERVGYLRGVKQVRGQRTNLCLQNILNFLIKLWHHQGCWV